MSERRNHLHGIGMPPRDGHTRITRGRDFTLSGGDHETHEHMQEVAIRTSEALKKKGTTLGEACPRQMMDAIREAEEKTGE
jgi:hypothetical protein